MALLTILNIRELKTQIQHKFFRTKHVVFFLVTADLTMYKERADVISFSTTINRIHHRLFIKNPSSTLNYKAYTGIIYFDCTLDQCGSNWYWYKVHNIEYIDYICCWKDQTHVTLILNIKYSFCIFRIVYSKRKVVGGNGLQYL